MFKNPVVWIRNDLCECESSCEFLEFPIRILRMVFRHILKYKKTLLSIKNKNLPTSCHFLLHTTALQSRVHRPNIRFKILIYLLFHFCQIRIHKSEKLTPFCLN